MSVSLAQLKARRKPLTVTYEGSSFGLNYKPGEYTEGLQSTIKNLADSPDDVHLLSTVVERLVQDWDIVEVENGPQASTKSEYTRDNIEAPLLQAVVKAVLGDLNPGETTAPAS